MKNMSHAELPARDRHIIDLRRRGCRLDDIALIHGITRQHVSRIVAAYREPPKARPHVVVVSP